MSHHSTDSSDDPNNNGEIKPLHQGNNNQDQIVTIDLTVNDTNSVAGVTINNTKDMYSSSHNDNNDNNDKNDKNESHKRQNKKKSNIQEKTESERQSKEAKKLKMMVAIKIVARLIVIGILITIAIQLKINVSDTMSDILTAIHNEFGNIYISALVYCILATLWTGISPMGYLPTLLAGILYPFYIAPFIAYISVNIGSYLNILLIRKIILHFYCTNKCFQSICGRKMGRISYLENILKTNDSNIIVKIVLLARLPYLSNGTFNYLFGLSSIKIIDYVKGNAIGFIPGAILFSTLGLEFKSLVKMIDEGPDSTQQLILFICVCIVAIVCYVLIVYKARLLLKEQSKVVRSRTSSKSNLSPISNADSCDISNVSVAGGTKTPTLTNKQDNQNKKQHLQRIQSTEGQV